MTVPVQRPGEWEVIADLVRRVRALEAICCGGGGSGFERAVAIRARSCHWWGLGDGSTVDGSNVIDYTGATDGTLNVTLQSGDSPEDGTPGTNGAGVTWALAEDDASYAGYLKNFCNLGGYGATPNVTTGITVDTGASSFTVNIWFRWDGYAMICHGGSTDSYGSCGIWGTRDSSDNGLYVYVPGETVLNTDPAPDPHLHVRFKDGAQDVDMDLGGINMGDWYMVTVTYDLNGTASAVSAYLNGGLVDSQVFTGTRTGAMTFGSVNFGGGLGASFGTWQGLLDEAGVWCDEALSGADVATLYYAGDAP